MNGIIIIDKPAGWTSHDVIAKLRGALKQKRIGHGGTLDPMATGVLPVFIGRATRAAEFCENAEKEYIAGLRLGIVTDTQDITGNMISENEVSVTFDDLLSILPRFMGAQKQIPPMYSAIKKDGKKLYELARQGVEVPREARDIYISTLELIETQNLERSTTQPSTQSSNHPSAQQLQHIINQHPRTLDSQHTYPLRIVCSKGTYIRTLCHDIGSKLGCGGTLSDLRRTRAGVYTIDKSFALDEVLAAISTDSVNGLILPIDSIFSNYPSITLSEDEVFKAKNGAACSTEEKTANGKYKVYAQDGEFLLLGDVKDGKIKTIKNFFEVPR